MKRIHKVSGWSRQVDITSFGSRWIITPSDDSGVRVIAVKMTRTAHRLADGL
jgi:hypothetical protein